MFAASIRRVAVFATRTHSPHSQPLRRWQTNGSGIQPPNMSNKTSFIPAETRASLRQQMERDHSPADMPSSSAGASGEANSQSTSLVAGIVLSTLAAAAGLGVYQLTSPLSDKEPQEFTQMPWYQRAVKRAKFRALYAYKYLVDPVEDRILPDPYPPNHDFYRPYTLVLELDKALVYSSWDKDHGWKTAKRPFLDYFLSYLAQYYELVIFTSQSPMYGDPIINKIDTPLGNTIQYRVYKDYTRFDIQTGNNVKDLSILNRDLSRVILMDPDSRHYETTQPDNAIAMPSFEGRPGDTYLRDMVPFLETLAISGVADVRPILKQYQGTDIPKKFSENTARYNEQLRQATAAVPAAGGNNNNSDSMAAKLGRGLLALMGLQSRPTAPQLQQTPQPFTEEEEEKMKNEHLRSVMETIEMRKRFVEEQVREQRDMQEEMTKHAKNVKVTLMDIYKHGFEQALLVRASPGDRPFVETLLAHNQMMAEMQKQQQQQQS